MNVNGSRFHLLLGRADWGACRVATGPARRRAAWRFWGDGVTDGADGSVGGSANGAASASVTPPDKPHWDPVRQELTLAPLPDNEPDTINEPRLDPASRRASAVDAAGTLYRIGDDGQSIRITPAGQENEQAFWPDTRADAAPRRGDFADAAPAPALVRSYVALAVTTGGYLVAWWQSRTGEGADRFDLLGGGAPETYLASPAMPGAVIDLAQRAEGGLWALLASDRGLAALDDDLRLCATTTPPVAPDVFQPDDGDAQVRSHGTAVVAAVVPLPAGLEARHLTLTHDRVPLVLADDATGSAVLALDQAAAQWTTLTTDATAWHAVTCGPPTAGGQSLFMVPPGGNQAIERSLVRTRDGALMLGPIRAANWPMRRHGGRVLALVGDRIVYDSGADARLVPLVARPQRAWSQACRFETPVWDSSIDQCQWDRVRIDAAIPAGTNLRLEARCADAPGQLERMGEAGWEEQPLPCLGSEGGELAGKGEWAMTRVNRAQRAGCWDLLLQRQRGRYCQLRLTLSGDGRATPRLRALRLWYPRFSYVTRFLPAAYTEDPTSLDFLERFLANIEGVATGLEGRIAAAEALFDPRTVPEGFIDWLASWFDVALDPAWPLPRRRLFLAHAIRFFAWRGTVPGIELALRMAFDETVTAADFAMDENRCASQAPRAGRIRIVESFSPSARPALAGGGAVAANAPVTGTAAADRWRTAEGSSGLWQRHRAAGGSVQTGPYPLFPTDSIGRDAWTATVGGAFGFVPAAGGEERAAWHAWLAAQGRAPVELPVDHVPDGSLGEAWRQFATTPRRLRTAWHDYLRRRYRRIVALNQSHGSDWRDFSEIPIAAFVPDRASALTDWMQFEGALLPRLGTAHRFSVLLPLRSVSEGGEALDRQMALARRIVMIEKPAHTDFDVRFYWAMNRVGEARIGLDSELGAGSRAPELIPPAVLGTTSIGSSFVAGPQTAPPGRARIAC